MSDETDVVLQFRR